MKRETMAALMFVLTGYATVGPNYAVCQNIRIVSTVFPNGSFSYIYSPGVEASDVSSTVTGDFEGTFWAMGAGHPSIRQGVDSGAFAAMGPDRDGWVTHRVGSPAFFHTNWAAGKTIDGCVDSEDIQTACTAVLLTDQHGGRGYFALLTASPARGNYSFAQPGDGPITLAPVPVPQLVDTAVTSSDVRATVSIDSDAAGLYLDASCPLDIVRGYRVYAQIVERDADAPTDRGRPRSDSGGDWVLADGGQSAGGEALSFETNAQVRVACKSTDDVYLATSLVFDSGFETRHVSANSVRIRCAD